MARGGSDSIWSKEGEEEGKEECKRTEERRLSKLQQSAQVIAIALSKCICKRTGREL